MKVKNVAVLSNIIKYIITNSKHAFKNNYKICSEIRPQLLH